MSEQEIKVDIELLKKDVVTMSALLEKFDKTIDKMQEIASNLSRMISLQEQRLENQEKVTAEVQSVLEMRRIEHNTNIKEVYNRIDTVNKEPQGRTCFLVHSRIFAYPQGADHNSIHLRLQDLQFSYTGMIDLKSLFLHRLYFLSSTACKSAHSTLHQRCFG